jgi:hypothetical protein
MSIPAPGGRPADDRQGQPDQVIIQPAGRSPATWALGSLFEHLAGAGQTGGQFGVAVVNLAAVAARWHQIARPDTRSRGRAPRRAGTR